MDAWARLFRDEREAWRFLLEEEFGMPDTYGNKCNAQDWQAIGYQPNGSNYHDHLCNCPGCNYDGPDPTEAEIQEWEKAMRFTPNQQTIMIECDTIEHTEVFPFCSDPSCPCHRDIENVNALTEQVEAGLLTTVEANLILRGATI